MTTPVEIRASTAQKYISADEFYELAQRPEYDGMTLDLIDGVVYVMPGPGGEHGEVTFEFGRLIGNFVKDHKLGRVTAAETGYILFKNPNGKDTVLGPDIGFISLSRHPERLPRKHVPLPPDLAVEVVCPGNTAIEIHNKVRLYLRAGTKLVWVVYPDSQEIVVHIADGSKTLTIDDEIDGEAVLPGFKLAVKAIFEE